METDTLRGLFNIIKERKMERIEDSYTCYLFEKGVDKILKKIGEESAEVIIAAKGGDNAQTAEEICDLFYHVLVLMAQQDIDLDAVMDILEERRKKQSNLKKMKITNKNT
jgi:phosphoribosyl-ATP pyrophosphohydrolase